MDSDRAGLMPNLFIVGAPKCGTTLLHTRLAHHPKVFMSPVKEPGHFDHDRSYVTGNQHYLRTYFRGSAGHPWRGESTPWYFYSRAAAERIRADCPAAKLLLIVRNPVERAWSHYQDQIAAGVETRTFAEACRAELRGDHPPRGIRQLYLSAGDYAAHLDLWVDELAKRQLLVLTSERLRDRPDTTMAAVAAHLAVEVGPLLRETSSARANVGGGSRSALIAKLLYSPAGYRRTRRVLGAALPTGVRRRAGQKVSSWNKRRTGRPPLPEEDRAFLDRYYAERVSAVESILGRPIPEWKSAQS